MTSKNTYYYYDHEHCSFIEVEPMPLSTAIRVGLWLALTIILAVAGTWILYDASRIDLRPPPAGNVGGAWGNDAFAYDTLVAMWSQNREDIKQMSIIIDSLAIVDNNREDIIGQISDMRIAVSEMENNISLINDLLVTGGSPYVTIAMLRKDIDHLASSIDRAYDIGLWIAGSLLAMILCVAGLITADRWYVYRHTDSRGRVPGGDE